MMMQVEAALTARDEIMVRNPSLEHRLTPAPQSAVLPAPAPTPAAAQAMHDDNEEDVEVYWSANNNNSGQTRQQNRR